MIYEPNYTQTPNELFDVYMKDMNASEIKVFMCIVRKTFGWHKTRDRISLSQIQEMAGISRQSAINGKKNLIKKNLIIEYKTEAGNEYEVAINSLKSIPDETSSIKNRPDQSKIHTSSSLKFRPEVVQNLDTQKKTKESIKKLSKEKADIEISIIDTIQIELRDIILDWMQERKARKSPVTERALKLAISELNKLYPDDIQRQIRCVEQTILNGWKGIFPLNEKSRGRAEPDTQEKCAERMKATAESIEQEYGHIFEEARRKRNAVQ